VALDGVGGVDGSVALCVTPPRHPGDADAASAPSGVRVVTGTGQDSAGREVPHAEASCNSTACALAPCWASGGMWFHAVGDGMRRVPADLAISYRLGLDHDYQQVFEQGQLVYSNFGRATAAHVELEVTPVMWVDLVFGQRPIREVLDRATLIENLEVMTIVAGLLESEEYLQGVNRCAWTTATIARAISSGLRVM
jgi:hypothetical protein